MYENSGIAKPGQVGAGSGTTPTLMEGGLVAITDNADPMNVVVYRRARTVPGSRLVCRQPVFGKGASATDNSLIAAGRSLVVENNYGYTGPTSTQNGATTRPGSSASTSTPRGLPLGLALGTSAPTVVPKLSAANGLVYTYTKDAARRTASTRWYLTALDFRTGKTLYKRLAGEGLGHNNNYAPVTLGPGRDGLRRRARRAGGAARRDAAAPPAGGQRRRHGSLRLRVRGRRGDSVVGKGVREVRRVRFYVRGKRVQAGPQAAVQPRACRAAARSSPGSCARTARA